MGRRGRRRNGGGGRRVKLPLWPSGMDITSSAGDTEIDARISLGRVVLHSCYTTSLARWLRRPPRERKIPDSNPACDGIFVGSSHTSDLKIGTPVATLPGAWRYRVRAGTGRPGVSIL